MQAQVDDGKTMMQDTLKRGRSTRVKTLIILVILCCGAGVAFHLSTRPQHDSLSILDPHDRGYKDSVQRASTLLTNAGFAMSQFSVMKVIDERHPNRKRKHVIYVRFNPLVEVSINGDSMKPYMIVNHEHRDSQYRNIGRTGKSRFSTRDQAETYLRSMLSKMGYPKTSKMTSFLWSKDGEVKDANTSGRIGATFVMNDDRTRVILSIDPQDGVLILYQEDQIRRS